MNAEERNAVRGKLENLIPTIDKLDEDWIADWSDETQEKYYVMLMCDINQCFITSDRTRQRIGAIYMSESTALYIKDKINKSLTMEIRNGNGEIVVKGK